MRVKYYGLAFDYEPSTEITHDEESSLVKNINQLIHNFAFINYHKFSKTYRAFSADGFMKYDMKLFVEMYMIDTNPRKFIYDDKEQAIFRILDMPLEQSFNPAKRRIYQLPIELVTNNDIRFDLDFIKAKFEELKGVANAYL